MTVNLRLLDHPFYQAWNRGEVSRETMGLYHQAYGEFIRAVPRFWGYVVEALQPDSTLGNKVVDEEVLHVSLWEQWGNYFPATDGASLMHEPLHVLEEMSPSALLGALHAFELQQPEVARVKKVGLIQHYRIPETDLGYFDAHQDEAGHIAFGAWLARHFANSEEFATGFRRGQETLYHSLDPFATACVAPGFRR